MILDLYEEMCCEPHKQLYRREYFFWDLCNASPVLTKGMSTGFFFFLSFMEVFDVSAFSAVCRHSVD
jgi:hypothetical protein